MLATLMWALIGAIAVSGLGFAHGFVVGAEHDGSEQDQ